MMLTRAPLTLHLIREVRGLLDAVVRRCELQGLPQDAGGLLELLLGFQMLQYSPGPGFMKVSLPADMSRAHITGSCLVIR
jgi:hypothetical protein